VIPINTARGEVGERKRDSLKVGVTIMAVIADKCSRYRKLSQSLAEIGDQHARAITNQRYRLMYHYFVRCSGLTSATVLLVENGFLAAAYALQKSIVDSMLNGLYIGYVAKDAEINRLITLALKGRGTGYSKMERRARDIDAAFQKRKPFMMSVHSIVKRTQESLNEFGHGGLLSTALEAGTNPPEVGNKVLADCVLTLLFFLGNVCILENLDLAPLELLMKEFDEAGKLGG
jgi:hypothetical protein